MTNILVYDTDAKLIEKIANENDLPIAEVVEMLLDYVDEVKDDNNLN